MLMWLAGAELHVAHRADEPRGELPDRDAEHHAGRHPEAEVALEDVHSRGLLHLTLCPEGRARPANAIGRLMPSRPRSRSTRHSSSTLTRRSSRSRRASRSICGSWATRLPDRREVPRRLLVLGQAVEDPAPVLPLLHETRPLEVARGGRTRWRPPGRGRRSSGTGTARRCAAWPGSAAERGARAPSGRRRWRRATSSFRHYAKCSILATDASSPGPRGRPVARLMAG